MKKIIITNRIKQHVGLELYPVIDDVEILTAYSNEDALNIHRRQKAHLIITELYGSGLNAVKFCSQIREDVSIRMVSIIVFCNANEIELRESIRCRANTVMTLPVDKALLRFNVQQLLSIPSRSDFRLRFKARCTGRSLPQSFDCSTENISVTGMLIESNVDLREGDSIHCSVDLHPTASFETQIQVVRTVKGKAGNERTQYGVRFSRLDPAARNAIETLIQKSTRN